ncbi:MAG: DinB family protein [Planctomycetes bacterium]|nr:DinB family protein [Planctomycetota bacterium]
MTPSDQLVWRGRIEAAAARLADYVAGLEQEYNDWRPDEGIASVREHLWAVAESIRALLARLSGRPVPGPSFGAEDVPVAEINNLIGSSFRKLRGRLDDDRELEIDEVEALQAHLELQAHHVGAIAVLLQLIDPGRRSALDY